MTAAFLLHGLIAGSFAGRIPALQEGLALSAGELGVALLMVALGCITTMQFGALLAHRVGERVVLAVGLVGWAALLPLAALAPSLVTLCVLLFLVGVASGNADVAMNALGVHVERRLGRSVMAGLHGFWSIGGVLGAGVAALAAHAGLAAQQQFAGVALVVVLLVAWCWRGWADPSTAAEAPPAFTWPSGPVLLIGSVAFAAVFAEIASHDWSAVFLRDVTGASAGTAALGVVAVAGAMAFGRLTGDAVVRRFGVVATVRTGGFIAFAGVVLLLATTLPWAAIAGFGLIGLGLSTVVPLAFAAAGRIGGVHPGHQIAAVATIGYGAGMATPFLVGVIAQLSSLQVAFGVVGALVLVVVVLAPRLRVP
ncbi:MAG TPA: MFS transporter [Candidatus Nanopelagicales bacterium]|nr:MFS transporter [Candidatus Nanopelagicales bacterium]